MRIVDADRKRLRDLAGRVAEIADDPVMDSRRRRWGEHNSLRSRYPMMLVFPEGSWCELLPDSCLQCSNEQTQGLERALLKRIYGDECFQ